MAKAGGEVIPALIPVQIFYRKPNQFKLIENFNLFSYLSSFQLTKLRLK